MNLQVPITQMKEAGQWPLSWTSAIGLVPMIKELGNKVVGCELGTSYGFNLVYFLDNIPNLHTVYAIDPYAPYHDGPSGFVPKEVMDKVRDLFRINTAPYQDKVIFLNESGDTAHTKIPDGTLDYIFIDGDHSYEAVYKDLRNYFSKVRPGGIFSGHDYSWEGVSRAVAEFQKEFNISAHLQRCANDVWYWVKE